MHPIILLLSYFIIITIICMALTIFRPLRFPGMLLLQFPCIGSFRLLRFLGMPRLRLWTFVRCQISVLLHISRWRWYYHKTDCDQEEKFHHLETHSVKNVKTFKKLYVLVHSIREGGDTCVDGLIWVHADIVHDLPYITTFCSILIYVQWTERGEAKRVPGSLL